MEMTYREVLIQEHQERQERFSQPRPLPPPQITMKKSAPPVIPEPSPSVSPGEYDFYIRGYLEALNRICGSGTMPEMRQRMFISDIITAVSAEHRIPEVVLKGKNRSQVVIKARFEAMYKARKMTGASMGYIGRAFGGRDPTSIRYSILKYARLNNLPSLGITSKAADARRAANGGMVPDLPTKPDSNAL